MRSETSEYNIQTLLSFGSRESKLQKNGGCLKDFYTGRKQTVKRKRNERKIFTTFHNLRWFFWNRKSNRLKFPHFCVEKESPDKVYRVCCSDHLLGPHSHLHPHFFEKLNNFMDQCHEPVAALGVRFVGKMMQGALNFFKKNYISF